MNKKTYNFYTEGYATMRYIVVAENMAQARAKFDELDYSDAVVTKVVDEAIVDIDTLYSEEGE